MVGRPVMLPMLAFYKHRLQTERFGRMTICCERRSLRRSWRCSDTLDAILQHNRPAVGRPGAADPDADHRLLLRHPLGTPAMRGGPSEPRLPVVLPTRPGGRGAGPL